MPLQWGKIIKNKIRIMVYEIAADGMLCVWSHDQFARTVKKEEIALLCGSPTELGMLIFCILTFTASFLVIIIVHALV